MRLLHAFVFLTCSYLLPEAIASLDKRALPEIEISDADAILIEQSLNEIPAQQPDADHMPEPVNAFNYEVSLEKYLSKLQEQEYSRANRKKLRSLRHKYDMLLRNSASEIMTRSWLHGKVADELFAGIRALENKARRANEKAQAYNRLADRIHNGDEVSDNVAQLLYQGALSRASSPLSDQSSFLPSAATLEEQFENSLGDQSLLNDIDGHSRIDTLKRAARLQKDPKMKARLQQFKASALTQSPHYYFDLIASRKKKSEITEMNDITTGGISEKMQRDLRKSALKELSIAKRQMMAAYEMSRIYEASAARHEAATAAKLEKYELSSIKRDVWKARARQGIRHLPRSQAHENSTYFSDEDQENVGSDSDDGEK